MSIAKGVERRNKYKGTNRNEMKTEPTGSVCSDGKKLYLRMGSRQRRTNNDIFIKLPEDFRLDEAAKIATASVASYFSFISQPERLGDFHVTFVDPACLTGYTSARRFVLLDFFSVAQITVDHSVCERRIASIKDTVCFRKFPIVTGVSWKCAVKINPKFEVRN